MTNEFKLDLTHRPRRMRRTALRALASETEVLPAFDPASFCHRGRGSGLY